MVHPQGPVVPLAHCRALGREGAAPPACGTRGTVCTRCTADCKGRKPGAWRKEETPALAVCKGGGNDGPALVTGQDPDTRSPALSCLHASALHQVLHPVCAEGKDGSAHILHSSSRQALLPATSQPPFPARSQSPRPFLGYTEMSSPCPSPH